MHSSPWIISRSNTPKYFRLYCFCYAGGSAASFMEWQAALDPRIELCAVQLPGRGARFHETPIRDLPTLISTLAEVIRAQPAGDFAFFGHSLGGLLAFELARYNASHGFLMPKHLFVSGCHAPQYRSISKGLHRMDDAALLEELKGYNGTPPEVLAHRELMALIMPTIRADFALAEDYKYKAGPPLHIPITVLAGKKDSLDSPIQVVGWQEETRNTCEIQWFEGDHFFIKPEQQAVLDCIGVTLKPLLEKTLRNSNIPQSMYSIF